MAIHCLARSLANRGIDDIGAKLDHGAELDSLQAIEIAQDIMLWAPSMRPTDADPAADEVSAAAVLNHRAQPIVARRSATDLEPDHSELEIELVVYAEYPLEWHLEEAHGGLNALPAQVHVGHGLEEHHVAATHSNLGELALELVAKARRTPAPRQLVDHHEPNVVAIARVLGARVSEARDEMRAHGPPGV